MQRCILMGRGGEGKQRKSWDPWVASCHCFDVYHLKDQVAPTLSNALIKIRIYDYESLSSLFCSILFKQFCIFDTVVKVFFLSIYVYHWCLGYIELLCTHYLRAKSIIEPWFSRLIPSILYHTWVLRVMCIYTLCWCLWKLLDTDRKHLVKLWMSDFEAKGKSLAFER